MVGGEELRQALLDNSFGELLITRGTTTHDDYRWHFPRVEAAACLNRPEKAYRD